MVLALAKCLIVTQQMSQLLHTSDLRILVLGFVNLIERIQDTSIILLVKDRHLIDLFVYRLHELAESLEVQFELLDQFFAILVKCSIEKFISNQLDLVCDLIL